MYSGKNPYFNALISNSWLDVGEDNIVTVCFANDYGNAWTEQEKSLFNNVFSAYETVCNVTFQTVDSATDADLVENLVTSRQMLQAMGYGWHGWQDEPSSSGSRGFFDATLDYWSSPFAVGSGAHRLVLHEIGHGLGLEHPHSTWHGSGLFPGVSLNDWRDLGDFNLNTTMTTVMSYNSNATPSDDYGQVAGPMAFDIAALQLLYGARDNATGDDTYYLPDSNGIGTYWTCIWDTGGTDEIAYTGNRDVVIDLRAATLQREPGGGGFFSNAAGIYGGVSIANGVNIENAKGGNGNDTLVGNWLANVLDGGDGLDLVTYEFDTADLTIDLRLSGPQVSKGAANGDLLINIEYLYGGWGNDTLSGDWQNNVLNGLNGNDFLYGEQGNDQLFGDRGSDNLYGGDGDDFLSGGWGFIRDYLSGGSGRDIFDFDRWTDSTLKYQRRDVILDFEKGIDDIDLRTIDANTKKSGNQAFKFIGTSKFKGNPGELRYALIDRPGTTNDDTYVYADVNGDKKADFVVELDGLIKLSKYDFYL